LGTLRKDRSTFYCCWRL